MSGPPPCPLAEVVEAVRTPQSPRALAETLAAGHVQATGEAPTLNLLAYGWAVVNHETAETRSMWNHNAGNIICTSTWKGDAINLNAGAGQPAWYRGYSSALAGAAAFWRLLYAKRYRGTVTLANAGAFGEAAREMGAAGYYTAPQDLYAGRVIHYVEKFKECCEDREPKGWTSALAPLIATGAALGTVSLLAAYTGTR